MNRLITVATTPGSEYKFRYRVSNVFGWSSGFSNELVILSAMPPETPTSVTTEIEGSYVKIDWDEPEDNFAEIIAYEIGIIDINGDQIVELLSCDG